MGRKVNDNIMALLLVAFMLTLPNVALAQGVLRVSRIQKLPRLSPGVRGPVGEATPPLPSPDFPEISPLVWHNVWLNVPLYSQNDPRWKNSVMQTCGRTVGQAGCALTSAAMVFKYYGGSKNPGQLNTCMGSFACPFYWGSGASHCSNGSSTYVGKYGFS